MEKRIRSWEEALHEELSPRGSITEETRRMTVEYAQGHYIGDVRITTGRFWTDKKYEERRTKVLETPLP
ncbi:hypothetical protein COU61_02410 [Candidatus Pacearchaeota archaeon CG10_big_fil_rev_8_21_14_0_10_35_13]|nr:MAG: hypothetical protein COU61_02410 [Candidatus Pacearchaeota archaeon CG10_big_fil_rev_8_21_14_0_10_35_13]